MAYKIEFTKPALEDFEVVVKYSDLNFEEGGEKISGGILSHIQLLTVYPLMGPLVRRRSQIRKIHHSPFTIYYRFLKLRNTVEILHIWHGSRRPPKFTP